MAWRTYGGGGRSYSGGDRSFNLTLPGFRGAVKTLILINVGVYFAILLMALSRSGLDVTLRSLFDLSPIAITHGWIWQLVTYGFVHSSIGHILGNMFQLWMFGTALEDIWGKRKFYEFYFITMIGAGVITVLVAFTRILGMTPLTAVEGASGAIMAVLVAFGILFAEQQIFFFPFPISIKAKYFVIILILINLAFALSPAGFVAYATHLGGALCGYLYVKFLSRTKLSFAASESYYGLRNSYYRWKRRRAAKKFEVYMRKHDRSEFFDEYGNYKAPEDKKKDNGESGRGGWVN